MTKNSFDFYDYWQTVNTFSRVFETEKAQLDDLLMRRRKAELFALVQKVIRNELCEEDRRLISLHWFRGMSVDALAQELALDRSSVYRRIERITNTLYEKMKYALSYRYDNDFAQSAAALLRKDAQKELHAQHTACTALQKCRRQLALTREELSIFMKMPAARIAQIEKDMSVMTVGELKRFLHFFGESAETFLFDESERG